MKSNNAANHTIRALAIALALAVPLAHGADLNTVDRLTQDELRLLSEDLAATMSFKPLIPSEALGMPGFDLGVAVTGTDLQNALLLSKASASAPVPSLLPSPSVRAHFGLPLNIDAGVLYGTVPDTPYTYYGGELRWAFLPGSTVYPAMALRGAFTKANGVDQLQMQTSSLDISISKGIAMFTPYGGVGTVWVKSTPNVGPALTEEKFNLTKVYAGVNINLGLNLAFEVDSTGGALSYGMKAGMRF